jgi:hypothetical protein
VLIDNPQFPPRRWDWFTDTPVAPSKDSEHEDKATHHELFHE